jgi:ABC-type phosphate/phosphonate transport system substrate-binding protein
VLNKEADLGAAKSSVFNMLARKDDRIKNNLKIIVKSEEFPSNVLVLRKDLPKEIIDRLRSVLLNMDTNSDGKAALKKFDAMKFIKARESDYHATLDIAHKNEIINLTDQH